MLQFKPFTKVDNFVAIMRVMGVDPAYTIFKNSGVFSDPIHITVESNDPANVSPFGEWETGKRFFLGDMGELMYGNPAGEAEEIPVGQIHSVLWRNGEIKLHDAFMTSTEEMLVERGYGEFLGNISIVDDNDIDTEDLETMGKILHDGYVQMDEGAEIHVVVVTPYETDELRMFLSDDINDFESLIEICDMVRDIQFEEE